MFFCGRGKPGAVGVVDEQLGERDGLVLAEGHLAGEIGLVEPGPRVEVVELGGLEPLLGTGVDHRLDVGEGRGRGSRPC